jgi:malic enzyme
VADRAVLAMACTPGVARVCTAIAERPGLAADYTWVANTVAIVTDGTAVLGLGDIGPAAAIVTLAALRGAARVAGKEFGLSSSSVAESAIAAMAPGAIVFALSNPDPEVHPETAGRHALVVATGRSDFPNQINNSLAFPGVFRGALDTRATDITDGMKLAAADAIAALVGADAAAGYVVPSPVRPTHLTRPRSRPGPAHRWNIGPVATGPMFHRAGRLSAREARVLHGKLSTTTAMRSSMSAPAPDSRYRPGAAAAGRQAA